MLTSRGWWLLFIVLVQCGLGAALSTRVGDGIAVVGFTLLAWIAFEWAAFAYQVFVVLPRLKIRRELRDERKAVPILWADGEFDVHVRATIEGSGRLPYVVLEDSVPPDARVLSGADTCIAAITAEAPAVLTYRMRSPYPGELRFEGVRVRIADRQGFFYHRMHIREATVYPVLPRLSGAEGKRRGVKRHNIFPPPGVHRLRRPGGGSELLDLRDYLPGDPPKMIAWKASARKDKLFTKEFESEVPLRCTLFVDASESTRLGSGRKTKLARLVNLAAGVAEAAVGDRDHVGLVVFDERETQVMRPKRTRRHVIDMLRLLAKAAARPTPLGPFADADALARIAYPVAHELYPELMSAKVNSRPFRMFWSPPSDYRRGWWVLAFAAPAGFVLLLIVLLCGGILNRLEEPTRTVIYTVAWLFRTFTFAGTLIGAGIFAGIAALLWLTHGLSGSLDPWRSDRLRRKQLGLLFASLDRAVPGVETHYLHDDPVFARRAQRFLADHHTRYPVRLYDARGRYMFLARPKLDVLAKALMHGIARGRDNELFVLLADLVDLAEDLAPVLQAVRVAVARHHQVMVVVPWQEDIPEPPREPPKDEAKISLRKSERFVDGGYKALSDELMRDYVDRYHRAYFRVRREFGRFGVIVVKADHGEAVQAVLDRLDRLRGVGRRR